MISIKGDDLSEAWVQTLGAVLDDGGKSLNVVTSWQGAVDRPATRSIVDDFISSRPKGKSTWPRWPIETVANTIFPIDLYEPELGVEALAQFSDWYLEGLEVAHAASPSGEYCQRLVSWDDAGDQRINQLAEVGRRLCRYADPGDRAYRYSSDYELAVENPRLDLRIQMPGRNRDPYGFPCLSHISLTVQDGAVHLTAMYRNQHLLRKAYGNYLGLSRLGWALAHHAGLRLGTVTVVATHADAEINSSKGFGKGAISELLDQAMASLVAPVAGTKGAALEASLRSTALLGEHDGRVVGVDLVDIEEFSLDLDGDSCVVESMFGKTEIEECRGDMERLAARFAAKEATSKALGTGFRGVDPREIIVATSKNGAPSLKLYGHAAEIAAERGLSDFECSLAHEEGFAVAVVIANRMTPSIGDQADG